MQVVANSPDSHSILCCPACVTQITLPKRRMLERDEVRVRCPGCLMVWTYLIQSRTVHRAAGFLEHSGGAGSFLVVAAAAIGGYIGTPGSGIRMGALGAFLAAIVTMSVIRWTNHRANREHPTYQLHAERIPAARLLARIAHEEDVVIYERLARRNPTERMIMGISPLEDQWLMGQRQLDALRTPHELVAELGRYVSPFELARIQDAVNEDRLDHGLLRELVVWRRNQFATGEIPGPNIEKLRNAA